MELAVLELIKDLMLFMVLPLLYASIRLYSDVQTLKQIKADKEEVSRHIDSKIDNLTHTIDELVLLLLKSSQSA